MSYFLLNILLSLSWMMINGDYGTLDFITGFIIGYFVLWLTQPFTNNPAYFRRFIAIFDLFFYFLYEYIICLAEVMWDVLAPRSLWKSRPDIVYIPLDVKSDLEIFLLGNMLSLTPGSLTLDVTNDRQFLVIHAMFAHDHKKIIKSTKDNLERRILKVTRG